LTGGPGSAARKPRRNRVLPRLLRCATAHALLRSSSTGLMLTVAAASFATMRIQLLLFALYRDLTGVDEMTVDVPDGATAGSAIAALRAADRRFVALPERPVVAINREYALLDERLSDGDELALLPPVAGG
jgi:molybdopterin converting factor small subunit